MSGTKKKAKKKQAKRRTTKKTDLREKQLIDFTEFVARKSHKENYDQFLRLGHIEDPNTLREVGTYLLKTAMGFSSNEFIPYLGGKEFAQFVPQSEDYYPWSLFVVSSKQKDLMEVFHTHALEYLLSDSAGKKNYAVITNLKEVMVCDFEHYVEDYCFSLATVHDKITTGKGGNAARTGLINKNLAF